MIADVQQLKLAMNEPAAVDVVTDYIRRQYLTRTTLDAALYALSFAIANDDAPHEWLVTLKEEHAALKLLRLGLDVKTSTV